jgi:hypothetical protein
MAVKPITETFDLEAGTNTSVDQVQLDAVRDQRVPAPTEEKYDPGKANDDARRNIAYALLALLILTVIFGLIAISFVNGQDVDSGNATARALDSKADAERLVTVLNIVFGPIVTLLGTATGFYFGSQAKREGMAGR